MLDTFYYYCYYYQKETRYFWDTLGPREYATILIAVGIIGYLAMKSKLKRNGI